MPTRGNSDSSEKKKPVLYIRTFGCQMNTRDSEVIAGLLTANGYRLTANEEDADIIIFNTCSVRQHAEDKVWSRIGSVKKSKTKKMPLIGLVGCMAQNYGQEVFRKAPEVDFVVGPQDIAKIPEIIKSFTGEKGHTPYLLRRQRSLGENHFFERKIWETDGSERPDEIYHTGFYEDKHHAFVVISEGCENFCSYCVVPYVRGKLRNRNSKDILREIEDAANRGTTKITLLGQNVNAFTGFIRLLELVNQIKSLKEFSFLTSHPKDTTLDLFKAMANLEKLKKSLHLPVQSGSDRILQLMNRNYTRKFYLDLAQNYRKIVKSCVLTTDIIVGFPTETESDFQDTVKLAKDIQFNAAYIFKYSPRPHTAALKFMDDVPKPEKERRHSLILELQKKISKNRC